MKHKIVVGSCIVALAVMLVLVAGAYHKDQVVASYDRAKQYASQKAREEVVKHNYNKANQECKRGQDAYDGQSVAYQKAHPARPVCDLEIVE